MAAVMVVALVAPALVQAAAGHSDAQLAQANSGVLTAEQAVGSDLAMATYRVGDAVFILWTDGKWYAGTILRVGNGSYLVTYDGFDRSYDEWVFSDRLAPR
jgi:hypothetical protein